MKKWQIESWSYEPKDMFSLSSKVVLVTGAASGVGRAIALGVAAFGANVVLGDLNYDGCQEVARTIETKTLVEKLDVTNRESIHEAISGCVKKFGKIDVLFNIAGINIRKTVLNLSETEWRQVLDVNLTGVYLCAKEAGRVMLNQGYGNIVNMSSCRGILSGANQSVYSASKAGVISLTKVLACELAPTIRVNALAPGYLKTPLVEKAMENEEFYEAMKNRHILKRFGEPEEIVGAAIFLASEASSFMTGDVLSVDGGWTAMT